MMPWSAAARAADARRRSRRKPDAERYASAAVLHAEAGAAPKAGIAPWLAGLVAAGILIGVLWPQKSATEGPGGRHLRDGGGNPPAAARAAAAPAHAGAARRPRVEPPPEEPPPPQFGLEEGDLSEAGDLAVAAGNTIMKEAEPEVAPPPPPLPPAPVFVDQPPAHPQGRLRRNIPARALDRGLEGSVVALITIDTSGTVTDVQYREERRRRFRSDRAEGRQATRFQPPVRNGRKVPARFRAPYEFRLE